MSLSLVRHRSRILVEPICSVLQVIRDLICSPYPEVWAVSCLALARCGIIFPALVWVSNPRLPTRYLYIKYGIILALLQPQFTPIFYSVSNVTLASEWPQTGGNFEDTNICKLNFGFSQRLSGQFEAIGGRVAEKIFRYDTPRNLNIYP